MIHLFINIFIVIAIYYFTLKMLLYFLRSYLIRVTKKQITKYEKVTNLNYDEFNTLNKSIFVEIGTKLFISRKLNIHSIKSVLLEIQKRSTLYPEEIFLDSNSVLLIALHIKNKDTIKEVGDLIEFINKNMTIQQYDYIIKTIMYQHNVLNITNKLKRISNES